jgi:hypothetical protein
MIRNTGIRVAFPFDFELRRRYALENDALTLSTTLTNNQRAQRAGDADHRPDRWPPSGVHPEVFP